MKEFALPKTWTRVKLGDIAEIVGGGTPSRSNRAYFGGDIPWATPTDITSLDTLWIEETAETITEEGLNNSSAKLLPEGTVLMASRATIGVTAIITRPMCTNQGFADFICNDNVLFNEYLAYWLPTIRDWLIQLAGGTTFKEISRATLANIEIPLPPLREQRRIVAILRQADKLRHLREQGNYKVHQLPSAIFYDMFGDPVENDKNFPTTYLKECISLLNGHAFKSQDFAENGIPLVRIGNVNQDTFDESNLVYLPSDFLGKYRKFILRPGDMVISLTGTIDKDDYGNVCFISNQYSQWFLNQRVGKIEPNEKVLLKEFLLYVLKHPCIKAQLTRGSRGIRQANIRNDDILSIKLPHPPIDLQREFATQVKNIQTLEAQNLLSRQWIEELRQSLLIEAFTGELTAHWREKHSDELQRETTRRDAILAMQAGTSPDIDLNDEADRETFTQLVNINLPKAVDEFVGSIKRLRKKRREPLKDSAFVKLREFLEPFIESHGNFIYAKLFQTVQNLSETVRQALIGNVEPLFEIVPEFDTSMTFDLAHYIVESAAILPDAPDASHPRYAILAELSEDQYRIYRATQSAESYFTAENLEGLELPQAKIRETLTLLAAAGLILEVGLPTPSGNATVYTTAYRALRSQDDAREADLNLLTQESV